MFARLAVLGILATWLVGCAVPQDSALPVVSDSTVIAPVERFVAAGRTAAAYADLTVALTDVGVGNPAVADAAELRLVALASTLAEDARSRPLAAQADALATTVWPALLAPALNADATAVQFPAPTGGESAASYIGRLCAGPLHVECSRVESQHHPLVVRAAAMRRANERMQASLARCLDCSTRDREWDRVGWTFESLDREASGALTDVVRATRTLSVVAR